MVYVSLSLSEIAFFGGMPCSRVDRYQSPQPRPMVACGTRERTGCLREAGQVISVSIDIGSTVTTRFKQDLAVRPSQAVERHAPPLCATEENIVLVDLGHDQPFADDRRRGAVTDSN